MATFKKFKNVRLRYFTPSDFMMIEPRPEEFVDITEENRLEIAKSLPGPWAFTLLCKDGIVACFGCERIHKGVGTAWAITSPLIHKHKIAFHRVCMNMRKFIVQDAELHRMQSIVDARFYAALRWQRTMGLRYESTLSNYGTDGQDFKVFSWTQERDGDYGACWPKDEAETGD